MQHGRHIPLIVLLILTASLLAPAASALSLSFNDFGVSGAQKISIYNSTSQQAYFIGNTSSTGITLNASESYMILIEPEAQDLLSDPSLFLVNLIGFMKTNLIGIVAVVLIIILIVRR